jgi:PAS domain S-box-containing protein
MSAPMSVNERTDRNAGYALILTFTLMVAGIAVTGYIHYRNYERHFRAEIENELSSIAKLKVGELTQWRKERLGDGAVLFKNATFSALVRRYLEQPGDTDAQRQLRAWMGKYHTAYQYARVTLYDTQGIRRMSVPEAPEPVDSTVSRNVTAILRSGQVAIEDFHRDAPDGPIHLTVVVPIFDETDNSRPLGVLALRIDPATYLYPFLASWPMPSQTAESLLVRTDGDDVLFLSELKFHKNAPLNLRIPLTKTEVPAVRAALGQSGIFEGVDYRGKPVIVAALSVPDSPWSLVSRINTADVYTPLRERLALTLAVVGVMLLGASLSMGLIWRQRSKRFGERDKAEETLRKNENKYRTLVENIPQKIFYKDRNSVYVSCNKNYADQLKIGLDEIVGKTDFDFFPKEFAEKYIADDQKFMKLGETEEIEEKYLEGGQEKWAYTVKTPIRDESGAVIGILGIFWEITESKLAEEKLRQSERLLAEAQKVARIGHWEWDIKSDVVTWSDEMFRVLGYEPGAITPSMTAFMDSVLPDEKERVSRIIKQSLEGECRYLMDRTAILPDGTRRIVHAEGEVERDESGAPLRMFAVVQDVTQIKEAEETLRINQIELQTQNEQLRQTQEELEAARAKYFDLYNLAPVGYFTISGQGLVLEANLKAANLLGIERGLLVNTPFTRLIATEDQDTYYLFRKRLFETGDPQTLEVNMARQDGSLFWALMEATVTEDTQSAVTTYHAVISDITERKQAENRAKLFHDVLDLSSDAVYIMDTETARPVDFNKVAHEQLGYTPEEMFGLRIFDIIVPEPDLSKWTNRVKEVEERGGLIVEKNLKRKDGSLIPVEAALSVADMEGKEYLVAVARDITERVKVHDLEITAKGLEIANRDLAEFAHVASHDLQEPLRTIIGFSDRLEAKFSAEFSPKALDYLRRIQSSGKRMSLLLQDILSYSLVSGSQLNFVRVDLNEIVTEVLEDLRGTIEQSGAILSVGPLPVVNADPSQMRQMFQNLISNAIKYRKPGGHPNIKVSGIKTPVWNRGALWEVVVQDDGIGFDNEHAGKIFKLFERLHGHSEYDGTGVGLATALKIVQRHGWTIKAEGEPDVGAKFTILMISLEE